MTSNYPRGTLGSVASLLAATLYQGNPDRNHKPWNIVRSLFVLFLLAIVLSVLRFTYSDYPFGIFKLFLLYKKGGLS
jgi:hypothetical protein